MPDLLKFATGIINDKFLKTDTMNQMATSMSTKAGRLTNYGMGWETTPYNGRYMLVHSGGQQETRTLLYILPARKMALAVGVNFEGANPGVYLDRLFQLLTGAPLIRNFYSPDKLKNDSNVLVITSTYGDGEPPDNAKTFWSALSADTAPINVTPDPDPKVSNAIHQIMLVINGIHLLENLRLDELAASRAYEFALVVQPLKIQGGTGSTVAPIAVR